MGKSKSIPKEIKNKVLEIVETFNKEYETYFIITFRKEFAFLTKSRIPFKNPLIETLLNSGNRRSKKRTETKLGRLKYNGEMDNWSFAVFRYGREFYDPDMGFFPGEQELDGTIEGALRAGQEIYK